MSQLPSYPFTPETRLSHPETVKFFDWIDAEKKKGLIDFKVFKAENASTDIEVVCKELNAMLAAPAVHDVPLD
jgi:hypothetical protein